MPPVGRPIARVPRGGLCIFAVVFITVLWGCPKAFTAGTLRWLRANGRSRIVERNCVFSDLSEVQAMVKEHLEDKDGEDLVVYVNDLLEVGEPYVRILQGLLVRVIGAKKMLKNDFTMSTRREANGRWKATLSIWVLRTPKNLVPQFGGFAEDEASAKEASFNKAFKELPSWIMKLPVHQKQMYREIGPSRLMKDTVSPKDTLKALVGRCHRRVVLRQTDLRISLKRQPRGVYEVSVQIGKIEGMPDFKPLSSTSSKSELAEWKAVERALEHYGPALRKRAEELEDPVNQPMPDGLDCVHELGDIIRKVDRDFIDEDLELYVDEQPDAKEPYKVTLMLPQIAKDLDEDGWGDVLEVEASGDTVEDAKRKAAWGAMSIAAKKVRTIISKAGRVKVGVAPPFTRLRDLLETALGPIAESEEAIEFKIAGHRYDQYEVHVQLGYAELFLGTDDTQLAFSGIGHTKNQAKSEALIRAANWVEEWLLTNKVRSFHYEAERANPSGQSLLLNVRAATPA